jgi:hypothetical protein
MRRANRILTVVVFGVFVTVGWSLLSHTGWAAAREYLGAGLDFDSWSDPLVVLAAMTVVAVAGTRLIEAAWNALFPKPVRQTAQRAGGRPVSV